ncbi:MAG: helix-turn-helix domain-containing protein [Pyrinomonadaceae bacterium]
MHALAKFGGEIVHGIGNRCLVVYDWPGNIRGLENTIEHAFTLSGEKISIDDDLPSRIRDTARGASAGNDGRRPTLEDIERRYVKEILGSVGYDKLKAAEILDIDLSTLYRKLKRIEKDVTER